VLLSSQSSLQEEQGFFLV
jgi:hypothetical protein